MNAIFLARIFNPVNGGTVLEFAHPDESRANYLAGEALDMMTGESLIPLAYEVTTLPYVSINESSLMELARSVISGEPMLGDFRGMCHRWNRAARGL